VSAAPPAADSGSGRAGRLAFLHRPGAWLWLALALGVALRVYLVWFTEGSFDVAVKLHHGTQIRERGLVGWYREAAVMNHPPLAGELFAGLAALAQATGLPFRALLRAPFALLDVGTGLLLLRLFRGDPLRLAVLAAWWLHPLVLVFSAYHGNTDPAVAFAALLATVLVSAGRPLAAGAALGAGLWIKLPVLVAVPVLFFASPSWRERWRFAGALGVVGLLGFLPVLATDPSLLLERVLGYPGSGVVTPRGIAIWGVANTLRIEGSGLAQLMARANTIVCFSPIVAFAWLRRGAFAPRELGASVCVSFLLLYGLTSQWAWQYLAWSLPFWFFLGWRFSGVATALIGAYVVGAYAVFTGSPWLQGRWDFAGHDAWPPLLYLLRDASVLLCLATGSWQLVRAAARELRRPRDLA
jgi:hypothetical protein